MNLRPSGYEPDELPGCSTARQLGGKLLHRGNLSSRLIFSGFVGSVRWSTLRRHGPSAAQASSTASSKAGATITTAVVATRVAHWPSESQTRGADAAQDDDGSRHGVVDPVDASASDAEEPSQRTAFASSATEAHDGGADGLVGGGPSFASARSTTVTGAPGTGRAERSATIADCGSEAAPCVAATVAARRAGRTASTLGATPQALMRNGADFTPTGS